MVYPRCAIAVSVALRERTNLVTEVPFFLHDAECWVCQRFIVSHSGISCFNALLSSRFFSTTSKTFQ